MKVRVIPVVTGVLGKVIKGLVQWEEDLEIRGQVETIQTTVLLRLTRILKSVLEINSSEKPLANAGMKNSQKTKIIVNRIRKINWLSVTLKNSESYKAEIFIPNILNCKIAYFSMKMNADIFHMRREAKCILMIWRYLPNMKKTRKPDTNDKKINSKDI